jgi:putative ABC transport system permease protein
MSPLLTMLAHDVRADVRYAARTLLKAPGFALAVVSLGLAVGATSAVYGTADWLLNRSPAGVVDPDRLVGLRQAERGREGEDRGFSIPQYAALRDVQDAFSEVATYGKLPMIVGGDEWQEQLIVQFASGTYFPLLGVRPVLGRLITPDDDVPGGEPAVVLSHRLWQSRFGGDPGVLGARIRIQADEGRIIGVLPASYEDYSLDWNAPADLWLPLEGSTAVGLGVMLTAHSTFFPILGRLLPDVSAELARERAQPWLEALPPISVSTVELNTIAVRPERELRISRRDEAQAFLGALLVVCALILGAASFCVINFFLGQAARRRREIALRSALGAGRMRTLRQLLTEASVMATATGVVAMALGVWIGSLLAGLPSVYLRLPVQTRSMTTLGALDSRLLATSVALGASVAFVLALLPMLSAFGDPITAIRGSGPRWGWGRFRPTARQILLGAQVGLAVVLSITAALYAQGFRRALGADSEYADPPTLLIARIEPARDRRGDFTPFYDELLRRLRLEPWVASAALTSNRPYAGGIGRASLPDDPQSAFDIDAATVTPGLFATLGVPLVAGRELEERETTEPVAIINRTLAGQLWPGLDPVGRSFDFTGQVVRVVGVVDRERCSDLLATPKGCAWRPLRSAGGIRTVNVRTVGPAATMMPRMRDLVAELGPEMAIVDVQTLETFLGRRVRAERAAALGATSLALFAVVLLVIGCASLFLSMVRESLREIAIRMALGATGVRVGSTIARHGAIIAALGAALGVSVAIPVTRRLADQFYGIDALHLPTFTMVPLLMLLVALGSVGWSARVATGTDPAEHLHGE